MNAGGNGGAKAALTVRGMAVGRLSLATRPKNGKKN